MFIKYLDKIYEDLYDKILGNLSIYTEDQSEVEEKETYNVTIIQPSSAIIEVVVNKRDSHIDSFVANWDDTYEVVFKDGINPNGLILNGIQGKISRDITIYASPAEDTDKHRVYNVNIKQSDNQTIIVMHNGVVKTTSFQSQKYDYITVAVDPNPGFIAGEPNIRKGVVVDDMTISATPAQIDKSTYRVVTIEQKDHQTITVTCNGERYTKTFAVPIGTSYKVGIKGDYGYNHGEIIDPGDGVVRDNMTISALAASIMTFTIYIKQYQHQYIVVTDGTGASHRTDFYRVPFNMQLTAKVIPDEGYNAGKLNTTSLLVTEDFTFTATDPSLIYYNLTVKSTTNQKITVSYKIPGSSTIKNIESNKSTNQKISVPYGTTWTASITADKNYKAGSLSGTKGTIKGNTTVSATKATYNNYKVSVTQAAHQTITLKRHDTDATSTTGWSNVPYGTKVTASISPAASYTAGTLNTKSKVIQSNFTFSASPATIITRVLTLKLTSPTRNPWVKIKYTNKQDKTVTTNRLLTDYHGQTKNLKFTIKYNTSIVIMADGDPDYIRIWYNHVRQADLHDWESYTTPAITSNTTYHCQGNYTRSPYYDENGNYDYDWYEGGNGDGGGDGGDVGGDDGGHGGGGGDF